MKGKARQSSVSLRRVHSLVTLCLLLLCCSAVGGDAEISGREMWDDALAEARAWKPGDMEKTIAEVKPAVVLVRHRCADGSFCSGTGFFVSPDGLIFSCAHVVHSSAKAVTHPVTEKTWIRTSAGRTLEAKLLYSDGETDVAVLLVDGTDHPCLVMGVLRPALGQEIVVFGFAGGTALGTDPSLTKGIISASRDSGRVLQIDAAVNAGCSGGPVVASGGAVIGIAWARIPTMAGTNFAIAGAAIPNILDVVTAALLTGNGAAEDMRLANARDSGGRSTLQYCVSVGPRDLVEMVISKGADVNHQDNAGYSVLHTAAEHKSTDIAGLLISKGARLETRDATGATPLFSPIVLGNLDMVRCLLGRGANPNASNSIGARPLHECVWSDKVEIARELVERGADVNALDHSGSTPLHWAALLGRKPMVEMLETHGGTDRGSLTRVELRDKHSELGQAIFDAVTKRRR